MSIQLAELHYRTTPTIDAVAIAERTETLIQSGVELLEPKAQSDTVVFWHRNKFTQYQEGAVPAQTSLLSANQPTDPEKYTDVIQQSWACENARDRLQGCTTSRLLTEMMSRNLEPSDRLLLFHGVLQACVEHTQPDAIVFMHSQQIVTADAYLETCNEDPIQRLGSLNVRFFRISNTDSDDMIMDTRGMDAIGLHDLQCHYRSLNPNDVSKILYNTALYIFENGPVIQSGQTIPGIDPNSKWHCQFENSLLEPKRDILDLNPGSPYAAGGRDR